MDMIEEVHIERGPVRVIDVGGSDSYWRIIPSDFLERNDVSIVVVNLPGTCMPVDHGRFEFVQGDGCNLEMVDDLSFDIAHSNSVIEHVGEWERMVDLASEISRVAQRYFVQTPNYWFPVEPHFMTPFFHWLPRWQRIWLVRHFSLGQWPRRSTKDDAIAAVDSARLLSRRKLRILFGDAEIVSERFLGLPKSLVAIRRQSPRLARQGDLPGHAGGIQIRHELGVDLNHLG